MKNRKIEEVKYKSDRFEEVLDDIKGKEILIPFLHFETGPCYVRIKGGPTFFAKAQNADAIIQMCKETNRIVDPAVFRKYQQA